MSGSHEKRQPELELPEGMHPEPEHKLSEWACSEITPPDDMPPTQDNPQSSLQESIQVTDVAQATVPWMLSKVLK